MGQPLQCHHCSQEFEYTEKIAEGNTKNLELENPKSIFSKKQETITIRVSLECPHCEKEDFYKVIVQR